MAENESESITNCQIKIEFLFDYWEYCAKTIDSNDLIPLESPLSVVDKILFILSNNMVQNSKIYLDIYLRNKLITTKYHNGHSTNFLKLQKSISHYHSLKKNEKEEYIESGELIRVLCAYKKTLRRILIPSISDKLNRIVHCTCTLDKHVEEIVKLTNILVSELYLNNRNKEDVAAIPSRLRTGAIDEFPFPKYFSTKMKKQFLKNQLSSNLLKGLNFTFSEPLKEHHFIFKITGLITTENFDFTYEKVRFRNPKHRTIQLIANKVEKLSLFGYIKDPHNTILASVPIQYYSFEYALQAARKKIQQALLYLNVSLESYANIEVTSYIYTSDYKNAGYRTGTLDKGKVIQDFHLDVLNNNPFTKYYKPRQSQHQWMIDDERLFINCVNLRSPHVIWQYIETHHGSKSHKGKHIERNTVLLLATFKKSHYRMIQRYIQNTFSPFRIHHSKLGITSDEQHNISFQNQTTNWNSLKKSTTHVFFKYLLDEMLSKSNSTQEELLKSYYECLLTDIRVLRNSYIHSNQMETKTSRAIEIKAISLLRRIRNAVYEVEFSGLQ